MRFCDSVRFTVIATAFPVPTGTTNFFPLCRLALLRTLTWSTTGVAEYYIAGAMANIPVAHTFEFVLLQDHPH
jgi:hypothetical protein